MVKKFVGFGGVLDFIYCVGVGSGGLILFYFCVGIYV